MNFHLFGLAIAIYHFKIYSTEVGVIHGAGYVYSIWSIYLHFPFTLPICRVATGQGKVKEIQGQGILELVREIWNFVESQGNLRKVREI